MKKDEFSRIRLLLGKTQSQIAQLLGCSIKAVQSFEQGLRKVPVHVERQLLFLLSSLKPSESGCWEIKGCPLEVRRGCPAWEFQLGKLCWFVNGTICHGETQETWEKKIKLCRRCDVFKSMLPDLNQDELGRMRRPLSRTPINRTPRKGSNRPRLSGG